MNKDRESERVFVGTILKNIGKETVSEEDNQKIRDSFFNMFESVGNEMHRVHEDIEKKRREFEKSWKKGL